MEMAAYDVVLFYVYAPLTDLPALRSAFRALATEQQLTGRLLIAAEGVNGTVAAEAGTDRMRTFQREFVRLVPAARDMQWKRSSSDGAGGGSPFIDMKISVVKELVGWGFERKTAGIVGAGGGASKNVGHLTPREFHAKLVAAAAGGDGDVVVMDMRNAQESALGHFENALLPKAKNMPDLGAFLREQAPTIEGKTVLMYCTGGIRCEKASLFLDVLSGGKAEHIYQLEGGIHKYLEEFSEAPDCQFLGKNFVFDKRGYDGVGRTDKNGTGLCQSCQAREPHLTGCAVCVVCRFQLLLCRKCLPHNGGEHFCFSHESLSECYSMFRIPTMRKAELARRIALLKEKERELLPEGRSGRNRRRTIRNCYTTMEKALLAKAGLDEDCDGGEGRRGAAVAAFCRSSGKLLSECKGDCWGFFGQGAMMEKLNNSETKT